MFIKPKSISQNVNIVHEAAFFIYLFINYLIFHSTSLLYILNWFKQRYIKQQIFVNFSKKNSISLTVDSNDEYQKSETTICSRETNGNDDKLTGNSIKENIPHLPVVSVFFLFKKVFSCLFEKVYFFVGKIVFFWWKKCFFFF